MPVISVDFGDKLWRRNANNYALSVVRTVYVCASHRNGTQHKCQAQHWDPQHHSSPTSTHVGRCCRLIACRIRNCGACASVLRPCLQVYVPALPTSWKLILKRGSSHNEEWGLQLVCTWCKFPPRLVCVPCGGHCLGRASTCAHPRPTAHTQSYCLPDTFPPMLRTTSFSK